MKDEFKSKNAIYYRGNCFHLYLNENYGVKEATEVVKAIKKIENIYLLNENKKIYIRMS